MGWCDQRYIPILLTSSVKCGKKQSRHTLELCTFYNINLYPRPYVFEVKLSPIGIVERFKRMLFNPCIKKPQNKTCVYEILLFSS